MKKAILTFTFFIVVIATHAQVKMHSDGRITFQTVANTTTQGISFGPTPDCNATFNGNVYFNKGGIFNKKAPNYGWMNCSRADSAFVRTWVVTYQSWTIPTYYVSGTGEVFSTRNYVISNQRESNSKNHLAESIDGQEALTIVKGLNGYYFAPEDVEIPNLENNEYVDPKAVEAMYADFLKRSVGLVGDNVENAFPEAVRTDPENRYCINYESVVTMLVEAVKEQQREIENLRKILKENGLTK